MKEAWEKYWPALLGAVVVMASAVLLWPSGEEVGPVVLPPPPRPAGEVSPQEPSEGETDEARRAPRGTLAKTPPPPQFELRETVVAVPLEASEPEEKSYDQDDPEVKQALSQVAIEIYEAADCTDCEAARRFFDHNHLPYKRRDIGSDSWIQETLRRRAGTTEVPVIVVDGQIVRGFSVESLQSALTNAVKKRVSEVP